MSEFTTLPSPTTTTTTTTEKHKRHIISSSFFTSPMSPTSTLDTKPFSILKKNPFSTEPNNHHHLASNDTKTSKRHWTKLDSRGIGLAIVDALNDDENEVNDDQIQPNKPETRMVLFGSHLKIQIPPLQNPVFYSSDTPKSADFGLRTRNSKLGFFSARNPGPGSASFSGSITVTEMELSEDYTCVITHGPNPKTTHIFDDCVVRSCCGIVEFSGGKKDDDVKNNINNIMNKDNDSTSSGFSSENFLSCCFTCKRNLGQGKDIYMYRGEKAFCSQECRYEEMSLEDKDSQKIKVESSDV